MMEPLNTRSPCIGYCSTSLGDDVCRGCQRTFDEITRWISMTDEEKHHVNLRLESLKKDA